MSKILSALLALLLSVSGAFVLIAGNNSANAAVAAFPGAEGYGTHTTHGRGGEVVQVTNLNDSGPGSLRAAINQSGPRIVVFRVGGTILLDSRLEVSNPNIYIAGQTAPGEGITLRMDPSSGTDQGAMRISTHDVVIRYLRFRPGDGGNADDSHDALAAYQEGGGAYNIVLDHNSFSWAVDENVNIYYDAKDVTISNNIISEALSNAGHPDGEHSKGLLTGGGASNNSIHNNLLVSNVDRNPQISGTPNADVRNNVIYNYGDGSGQGVTLISSSKGVPVVNWVNNYYKPGPESPLNRAEFATWNGDHGAVHKWYGSGNKRWTPNGDADARVWPDSVGRVNTEFNMAPVTTTSAASAYTRALEQAGASKVRDEVDLRLINEVKTGGGSFKDVAGPYPVINGGTPPADTDSDGMADRWESNHGMNVGVNDSAGDKDGDGWTNVEEYINSLTGDNVQPTPTEPTETVNPEPTETVNPEPTVNPNPTETVNPDPTETVNPDPTETVVPEPTPTEEPTKEPPRKGWDKHKHVHKAKSGLVVRYHMPHVKRVEKECYAHKHKHRKGGELRVFKSYPHGCLTTQ